MVTCKNCPDIDYCTIRHFCEIQEEKEIERLEDERQSLYNEIENDNE